MFELYCAQGFRQKTQDLLPKAFELKQNFTLSCKAVSRIYVMAGLGSHSWSNGQLKLG